MPIQKVNDLIRRGKVDIIGDTVQSAIDAGCDPEALLQGMMFTMDDLGERLNKGEIIVSEMLLAVKTLKAGAAAIRPYLSTGATSSVDRWLSKNRQIKPFTHIWN